MMIILGKKMSSGLKHGHLTPIVTYKKPGVDDPLQDKGTPIANWVLYFIQDIYTMVSNVKARD
jgi:hypothetical protein